jgi:signal transduction histidine kinase
LKKKDLKKSLINMHDFRLADARTKCHGLSQKMITLQEDGA